VIVSIHNGKKVPSLASIADEAKHIALHRSISPAFTDTGVLDYEIFVDQVLMNFSKSWRKSRPSISYGGWCCIQWISPV
jgi:hypothetical protein